MSLAVVGALTVDDIVTPDGQLHQQVAGGNALYAALGAALWSSHVRLISVAGAGWPETAAGWLVDCGVDTANVLRCGERSVALWILYESDGTRQIVYKRQSGSLKDFQSHIQPTLTPLLSAASEVAWLHVAALPVAVQTALLGPASSAGPRITVDSLEAVGSVGGDLADYWSSGLLSRVSVFLPSDEELDVIRSAGAGSSLRLIFREYESLQQLVVKSGSAGAVVYDTRQGTRARVPCYPTTAADPTGAGDVFCGAFLAGMDRTGDPVEAAVMAASSASFAVEKLGAFGLLDVPPSSLATRANAIRSGIARSRWEDDA